MVVRKILGYAKRFFYDYYSLICKKFYKKDRTQYYRYGNEIFYHDRKLKDYFLKKYDNQISMFWKEKNEYSLSNYFMARFAKQYELIFEKFLPRLSRDAQIADLGCAAGEWTIKVLPFVGGIDGYDYSDKMVIAANDKIMKYKLNNITFTQADARDICFKKKYDGMMILGMLLYIEDIEDIYKILCRVFESMKSGAYLVTKDTLNCENRDVVFLFNRKTGYEGIYWSKDLYYKQFEKAGFVLVDELLMDEVTTRHMHFIAQGAIWRKQ